METLLLTLLALVIYGTLAVAAAALAWWAFRMVFWIVIIFIGEAGRAWRG